VHQLLRERKGARMTALTSGGTIPDTGDYAVLLEPQAQTVGSVHEDFAVESLAGDVFQLGNTSYRILKIEPGRVRVEDAQGAAPNIPFWLGEAPGRSDALSLGVSRLRAELAQHLRPEPAAAREWLQQELALDEAASSFFQNSAAVGNISQSAREAELKAETESALQVANRQDRINDSYREAVAAYRFGPSHRRRTGGTGSFELSAGVCVEQSRRIYLDRSVAPVRNGGYRDPLQNPTALVGRYEAIRTKFILVDGIPNRVSDRPERYGLDAGFPRLRTRRLAEVRLPMWSTSRGMEGWLLYRAYLFRIGTMQFFASISTVC